MESEEEIIMESHKQFSDARPQEFIGVHWSPLESEVEKHNKILIEYLPMRPKEFLGVRGGKDNMNAQTIF